MKWLYKATAAKVPYEATRALADEHGFLVRSAHDDDRTWASNVRYVSLGDELHVYYVEDGHVRNVGAYEVIDRAEHPTPNFFGQLVPETALLNVDEPGFIAVIEAAGGYKPDQVTGRFTGWPLRRLGNPIPYDPSMFPAENTLMRNGRASSTRLYKEEDEAFEDWCKANPGAFYANLHGSQAPTESGYFLLHRATCRVGAGRADPETPQPRTGFNPKLAGTRIEDLVVWAAEHRPKALPVQRCKSCVPLDDLQPEMEPTADPHLFERRLQILLRHDVPERPAGTAVPEQKPVGGGQRYVRCPDVAAWALKRAAGRCELCLEEAPFRRAGGEPFLEAHHIAWLANGGADTPNNTAGVCPNCHRRLHHGHDAGACAERLRHAIATKESKY